MDLQVNVKGPVVGALEIGKRLWLLSRARNVKGLQGFQRNHPGRNRSCKVFGQKGTERNVFPFLDIACAPIVYQDHAENVIRCSCDGNGFAELITGADKKAHFQLEIQRSRGTKVWQESIVGLGLAAGPVYIHAAGDDGAGSAMVRHRQMQPVGQESVFWPAQHGADVMSMLAGGIEIGVIFDAGWQKHLHVGLTKQGPVTQGDIIPESGLVSAQQSGYLLPGFLPGSRSPTHEFIQCLLSHEKALTQKWTIQKSLFRQQGQIQNEVADGDTDPANTVAQRIKHAIREILNRKMRFEGDRNERS